MIYTYHCHDCDKEFDRVLALADYKTPQTCDCGGKGRRVISVPVLAFAKRDCVYDSPIDGRAITSWAQRRDDLARNGCQEYDPEMKTDAARYRERTQSDLERSVDDTVDAAIDKMDNRQRESLANELQSGVDAAVVRGSAPSP